MKGINWNTTLLNLCILNFYIHTYIITNSILFIKKKIYLYLYIAIQEVLIGNSIDYSTIII